MKKILTILLLVVSCHAFAQKDTTALKAFKMDRIRTTSHGMEVLGGWGLLNIGTGAAIGWSSAVTINGNVHPVTAESGYFFRMNTIWGSVNFVTALMGYASTQKDIRKKMSADETLKAQERIEKIFFVNGCLDVAYLGTGLYLKLAGDSRNSPLMKGYGESILMQGGFLLLFDGLMYKAEKGNGTKLRNFLEKHPITFDGRRVGIIFQM